MTLRKNLLLIVLLLLIASIGLNIYFSAAIKITSQKSNLEKLRTDSILSSKLHVERNFELAKRRLKNCIESKN
jgi:hypothetical protein